jgi:hypothetical protein
VNRWAQGLDAEAAVLDRAGGIGLFALRLNSDGWWTGHLVYSLTPR